jgi:FkbM family methyltransferase
LHFPARRRTLCAGSRVGPRASGAETERSMTDLIYSAANRFTSLRDPYMEDRFVARMFRPGGDAATARARFDGFLKDRPLLPLLLGGLARARAAIGDGAAAIPVIDCGVFMGSFSVAVALQAARAGLEVEIAAHEANPVLVDPIRANMALYGLEAALHAQGIGGGYGTLAFAHEAGGLLGGGLAAPGRKDEAGPGATILDCAVIPLRDVLPPELAPGLVKLDIRGSEVAAFGSVRDDAGRINNVWFVEFAPFQARLAVGGGTYGDFLLAHYAVFDVGNWLWMPHVRRLGDIAALETCLQAGGARAHNTDLLLIPQDMAELVAEVGALGAPQAG